MKTVTSLMVEIQSYLDKIDKIDPAKKKRELEFLQKINTLPHICSSKHSYSSFNEITLIYTNEEIIDRPSNRYTLMNVNTPGKVYDRSNHKTYAGHDIVIGRVYYKMFTSRDDIVVMDKANVLFSWDNNSQIEFNSCCPNYLDNPADWDLYKDYSLKKYFTQNSDYWLSKTKDVTKIPEWFLPCFEEAMNKKLLQ